MLTEESQFHTSTPWGLNPGPSWQEANGWTTGPVELCINAVRLHALHRAPPQQPTMSVVKREGGQPGQKSCVRLSGINTLFRHDGLVTVRDNACLRRGHNDQSRQGHQCSKTTLTGESRFTLVPPWGLNPGPSWWETNGWTTGPVELCMNARDGHLLFFP
jgi:phospholipase/lecithinase/hemolysin